MPAVHVQLSIFLSTLSLRRATQRADSRRGYDAFLSTLSLRRATAWYCLSAWRFDISIHALLAESDGRGTCAAATGQIISIHALLAESDGRPSRILWLQF